MEGHTAMSRRRTSISIEAYQRGLESTGEVRIGAYARRQRRRRVLVALLGVLLIAGAVGLYMGLHYWMPHPGTGAAAGTYPVKVRCVSCGYSATLDVPYEGITFPLTCPRCGERACKQLWKCRACGEEFLPEEGSAEKRCPACGSLEVGSAAIP
jgi:predicted RNA-binding Zn-ribbon protein involved in translation (DUF1610 family)